MPSRRIPLAILGTGSAAPLPSVSTALVAERLDMSEAALVRKTGILARGIATPEARFGALGAEALRAALAAAGLEAAALERLILVDSTGGDDLTPANANRVALELGIGRTLDCFDLNNACCGFLSALDLAARCIATGYETIAIITVELVTRFIDPSEPRSYAVFGDGATATIVGRPRGRGAMLGSYLRNDPADIDAIRMEHPAVSGKRPILRFGGSSDYIAKRSVEVVAESVAEALLRAGCTFDAIRWVVPHQPNGPLLDRMLSIIGARPSQYVRMVHDRGSMAAASIPIGLDALLRTGQVRPGDRCLFFGVGGGASYGAIVIEFDGAEGT
jgi:3-oxoacyl-[acyl-carrier-protein] synthase III